MGEIYARFKELKKQCPRNRLMDKIGLVKFEDDKKYEIYFIRKRANRHSVIHCKNRTVEWEQIPFLHRAVGKREPMISIAPRKECVRIIVILGKPNGITGLDEGDFRSFEHFDEKYINVMTESCLKELSVR